MEEKENPASENKRHNPFWNSNHNSFSKYAVVATFLFLVFICFISRDNLLRWYKARRELRGQETEKAVLRAENEQMEQYCSGILSSKDSLERHARETAFFTESGDDVWLIDE